MNTHLFACLFAINLLTCSSFTCSFVCLIDRLLVCLFVCLFACLLVHFLVYLFIYLFICLFVHLFVHLHRCQISFHPILQLCCWLIIHPLLICHCPTNLYCCLICFYTVLWLCWSDLLWSGYTTSVVVSCFQVDSSSQSWFFIAHCHHCLLSLLVAFYVVVWHDCTSALFT